MLCVKILHPTPIVISMHRSSFQRMHSNWLCSIALCFLVFTTVTPFTYAQDINTYLVKGELELFLPCLEQIVDVEVYEVGEDNLLLSNALGAVVKKSSIPRWSTLKIRNENSETVIAHLLQCKGAERIEPVVGVRIPEYHRAKATGEVFHAGVTNDPRSGEQWALQTIQASVMWNVASGKDVKIGVIDTGVDFEHEDLRNNIYVNETEDINKNGRFDPWPEEVEVDGVFGDLNGIDDDNNGYPDDVVGYDFVDQAVANFGDAVGLDPIPMDEHGHGTSVAGVIAAEKDNGLGIAGLAFEASIVAIRAFDVSGNAEDDDIAMAIIYGIASGCDILSCSFGDSFFSPIIQDAVTAAEQAGVIIVTSSGNAGGTKPHYPGNLGSTISVGATTEKDGIAFFSVRGSAVDMVAPGTNILTTDLNNTYQAVSGTSFATPYVAAGIALAKSMWPEASALQLQQVVLHSAVDLGDPGWDSRFANGRLDMSTLRAYIDNRQLLFASIDAPQATSLIDIRSKPQLFISVGGASFAEWTLEYGLGEEPSEFSILASGSQVLSRSNPLLENDRMSLPLGVLDTTCVLKLTAWSTAGRQVQDRLRVRCVVDTANFAINDVTVSTIWRGSSTVPAVRTTTNWPSWPRILFGDLQVMDRSRSQRQHVVVGEPTTPEQVSIAVAVFADVASSEIGKHEIRKDSMLEASWQPVRATSNAFSEMNVAHAPAYIVPEIVDITGNGKPNVVVNDWSSGVFGNMQVLEWNESQLFVIDEVRNIWIPRAVGESNGDGRMEVLAHRLGAGVLYQSSQGNTSPFAETLHSDTLSGGFWASSMYDVDGDNLDEIIARSDEGFYVLDYQKGMYVSTDTIGNPSPPGNEGVNLFGPPVSVAGDIDGDGNIEIVFGDKDSDIIVTEFSGGRLSLQQSIPLNGEDGGEFLAIGNVDGIGHPEILSLSHQPLAANEQGEYEPGVWTLRILQFSQLEGLRVVQESRFYGVKPPNPYRSGLVCTDVNNDGTDDILVSMFPHTYIFSGGADIQSREVLKPLWYHPVSLTNSIGVYDFSGDGALDVLFGSGNGLEVFEQQSSTSDLIVPYDVRLTNIGINSAEIAWQGTLSIGSEYGIWIGEVEADGAISLSYLGSADVPSTTITDLSENTLYVVAITSQEKQNPNVRSGFSTFLDVYPHAPYVPVLATWQSPTSVRVDVSGPLLPGTLDGSGFALQEGSIPIVATAAGNSVYLQFAGNVYEQGEQLFVPAIEDVWGGETVERTLLLSTENPDQVLRNPSDRTAPLSFLKDADNKYRITFAHAAASEALSTQQFTLWPTGTVVNVTVDGNSIVLNTETFDVENSSVTWSVHLQNIEFDNGKYIDTEGEYLWLQSHSSRANNVQVYPSPADFSRYSDVNISGLQGFGEVVITTLQHELVRSLSFSDVRNVYWDGRDTNGNEVPSGVYLFRVESSREGEVQHSAWQKVAVKR